MAEFGQTLMSVAQKWQNERDIFEISKIQSATEDFHYGLMRQLEDDWISGKFKDASQFVQAEADYEKAREKNISDMLKGKRGRIVDNVRRYTDNTHDQQGREFFNSLYRKEKEFRAVETEKLVEGAVQRGNRMEALKFIQGGEHWLGLGKAKIMTDLLDYQLAAAEIQKTNFLSEAEVRDPVRLRAVSNATGEQLLSLVDFGKYSLTPEQKDDLIRYADGLARKRAGIAKNMLDMIQEQTDIDFFGEYFKGTLDPADITEAVANRRLDRAAGDRWLDALANPRDFPTNPAVEAELLRRIEDPTEVVTKTDVLNLMGDGLSVDDTRRFLTDIDFFKSDWFKRADYYLKNSLGWSDTYTKFMNPEAAFYYHLALDDLFNAIEKEKLRENQIWERAKLIGSSYMMKYYKETMTEPDFEKIKLLLTRKTVTKKKTEKKKQGDVLDPEGIFK